ncbi:ribonucleases P/MRP protein subunit POP1-like [Diadema antillarum]|uniref:ribonucleases P/MRP protein subunit POP1-like n=1 Tax=Diadema antillarum TaxID=105358 RepID=UPI003A854262
MDSSPPRAKVDKDVQDHSDPRAINVASFATARAAEINTMMDAITSVGSARVPFQRLPRHMQRRAMSHNIKRLPRWMRAAARQQAAKDRNLKSKDGGTPLQPKKSRRHRRRPGNLQEEYQRRQHRHQWLETHIWHAKRFKMVEKWGWKIPLHPSDKSARATYRATARHCVLMDISYNQVVELSGAEEKIIAAMKHLTSSDIGLTMASKAFISGRRHGEVLLYHRDCYPHRVMGPISYLWQAELPPCESDGGGGRGGAGGREEARTVGDTGGEVMAAEGRGGSRRLWMWVHPSCLNEVLDELRDVCGTYEVRVESLGDELLRFRLQGPLAHPILLDALQLASVTKKLDRNDAQTQDVPYWWEKYYQLPGHAQVHEKQAEAWKELGLVQTATEVASNAVFSLIVRDPRILLPKKRTKCMVNPDRIADIPSNIRGHNLTPELSISPLWNADIRQAVGEEQEATHELNQLRSQLLVPGTDLELGRRESRIPVLLLQHTGTRQLISGSGAEDYAGMLGYGGGWDLVLPRKWGMAFWVGLIYRGARACGLREMGKLCLHRNVPRYPEDFPDSETGCKEVEALAKELEETFTRKPPAKRPNHAKLGVCSPFRAPWDKLIHEWTARESGDQTSSADTAAESADRISVECSDWCVLRSREKLNAVREELHSCGKRIRRTHQKKPSKPGLQGTGTDVSLSSEPASRIRCLRQKLGVEVTKRTLVWVGVRMVGRGFPTQFAMICLPTSADLAELAKNPSYGGPEEPIHKEFSRKRMRKAAKMEEKDDSVKRAKVSQKAVPEPPSTPRDMGYVKEGEAVSEESSTLSSGEQRPLPTVTSEAQMPAQEPNKSESPEASRSSDKVHKMDYCQFDRTESKANILSKRTDQLLAPDNTKSVAASDLTPSASSTSNGQQGADPPPSASGGRTEEASQAKASSDATTPAMVPLLESCTRTVIGFLTNGAQAFSCGEGMGVGFCVTSGLLELMRTSPQGRKLVVLVRNTQSLQYRFAYIYVP